MPLDPQAKVNPFYIQDEDDEEDPWDDDQDDDYDDEQVMLINRTNNNNNRRYNVTAAYPNKTERRQRSFENKSYHNSDYGVHQKYHEHTPQYWKYGLILGTIVFIVLGSSLLSSETNVKRDGDYESLIDEIPNDEYRIVILGERHSGASWMRDRLQECFPHVDVSTHLQRSGHFFQDEEDVAVQKAQAGNERKEEGPHFHRNTIVVHVTLNVYDWLEQMRLSPEYAPDHAGKQWKEFLTKPWTMERPSKDLKFVNSTGPVCQMGFAYDEIVSCARSKTGTGEPVYELQQGTNGTAFESLIELRAAKLKNHRNVLKTWPSVKKFIAIQYETTAETFQSLLLREILGFTGWNGGNYENEDSVALPCSGNVLPPSLDLSKGMTLDFIEFVTKRVDWEVEESAASYLPWSETEIAAKGIRQTVTKKTGSNANANKQSPQPSNSFTDDDQSDTGKSSQKDDSEKLSDTSQSITSSTSSKVEDAEKEVEENINDSIGVGNLTVNEAKAKEDEKVAVTNENGNESFNEAKTTKEMELETKNPSISPNTKVENIDESLESEKSNAAIKETTGNIVTSESAVEDQNVADESDAVTQDVTSESAVEDQNVADESDAVTQDVASEIAVVDQNVADDSDAVNQNVTSKITVVDQVVMDESPALNHDAADESDVVNQNVEGDAVTQDVTDESPSMNEDAADESVAGNQNLVDGSTAVNQDLTDESADVNLSEKTDDTNKR